MKSLEIINSLLKDNPIEITHDDPLNIDYEGFNFRYNNMKYKVRSAKKTPKKSGYFTVVWIKDNDYKNIPYSESAFSDFLIVTIFDCNRKGIFIFPKEVLVKQGIIRSANNSNKGKMAFRVYTPWDDSLNPTAAKTLKWQVDYFYEINDRTENILELTQNF